MTSFPTSTAFSALRRRPISLATEFYVVAAMLAVAAAVRIFWASKTPILWLGIEPERVAYSLATTGEFGNAFAAHGGPTAHLSPMMPTIMSVLYTVFGAGTTRAELALALFCVALVTLSFGLTYVIARELGAPLIARLVTLAALALVPVQISLESRELRTWEAPLVIVLVDIALLWLLRLDRRTGVGWGKVVPVVIMGAVVFLASPPASLTIFVLVALFSARRLTIGQGMVLGMLALLSTAMIVAPWAMRNERELGRPIITRSNGGLELALAYNDRMMLDIDHRAAYRARMLQIHPAAGDPGLIAMKAAGGEVAYYDKLGAETKQWIVAHPVGTASLLARHLGEYVMPPAWFFDTFTRAARAPLVRQALLTLPIILALAGLPWLIRREPRYWYVVTAIVLLAAPYIVVQPILRYRYLTSTLIVFVACHAVALLLTRRRASIA